MKRFISIIAACMVAAIAVFGLSYKQQRDEEATIINVAIQDTPIVKLNPGMHIESELHADNRSIVRTGDNRAEVYFFHGNTGHAESKVTFIRDVQGAWRPDEGPDASW